MDNPELIGNETKAEDAVSGLPGELHEDIPSHRRGWVNWRKVLWCVAILMALALVSFLTAWHAHTVVMAAGKGRIYRAEEAPAAEVALVFGARVYDDGDVSWPLKWRLETASNLYKRGLVKRILVSGDNRWKDYNEPMVMKQWLVDNGVPEEHIACDYAGRRTLDSCARAVNLWGVRDNVILVSQAYHLPRALFLAQSWGMDAVAVPADRGTFRRDLLRERLARVKAWLDVTVLGMEPTLWGPPERWPDAATDKNTVTGIDRRNNSDGDKQTLSLPSN